MSVECTYLYIGQSCQSRVQKASFNVLYIKTSLSLFLLEEGGMLGDVARDLPVCPHWKPAICHSNYV